MDSKEIKPLKKKKWVDLSRITDKMVLIVTVFLLVLGILAVTLVTQNQSTRRVLKDIRELRIPVPITTADIISGANRVSASQRAYLMTSQEKYKQERQEVWDRQIKPAAEQLAKLRERMRVAEHRQAVDKALEKLALYAEVQENIDAFFEKELKNFSNELTNTDSASIAMYIANAQAIDKLSMELNRMVAGDASTLRKELRNELMPLNNAQEEFLIEDSANVEDNIVSSNVTLIVVSVIGAIVVIFLAFILLKSLRRSIQKPTMLLGTMAKGELPENGNSSNDELDEIIQAADRLSENMKKASRFALKIGDGKFEHDFEPASEKDLLGNSLIQMRDRLQAVAEEDRKSNWVNTGMAKLGNILRKDYEDESQFYNDIVSFVIKYLDANQGAMFLVNEDEKDKTLDLAACYAYGRRKYIKKQFAPGDGQVGQVYLEGKFILLKEIPAGHLKITSGLGEADPNCIMVCPLMANDESYGVLEIATFKDLEDYQVAFVERLCEQIAGALSKLRITAHTQRLLHESQQQAEELKTQEEEMRQNMEELTATQEEMTRKDTEMSGQLSALNHTMATIEFTMDGIVSAANETFLKIMGYAGDEVQGKHHRMFVDPEQAQSNTYKNLWQGLNQGIAHSGEFQRIGKAGKNVWFNATYTPILNKEGVPYKVIKFAQDITEQKVVSMDFEGQMTAINNTMAAVEFDLDGIVLSANKKFLDAMGYSLQEVKGKHHSIFADDKYIKSEEYIKFWRDLANGIAQTGEFNRVGKNNKDVWLSASYTPVLNEEGKPYKIVKFARDITEQKLKTNDFEGQLTAIRRSNAVIEFDVHGKILDANRIFVEAMGYQEKSQLIGKHHSIFVAKADQQSEEYKKFWDQLANGEYFTGEFKRKKFDGSDVWIRGSYNPIFDTKGRPYKAVKFAQIIDNKNA
ncbi:PAS domain S-box protein [Fulvivirga sp. M361]|uniref:PAS domain S-box protein n=1 Tax=Fulvivirga sp. M361 TaxID=2594266 RepID=UPI00117B55AF|nr:PAS domain S-box protein [Fulvivirga sp. M361]TRX60664.1 PAS domain S-box protein [Fulvivirga sp. M361]